MMLSEGSLPEHHAEAFDITYSWNIYDALLPLLTEGGNGALLDQVLERESLFFPAGALRLRFNTNHDKNAWDAPAVKKFGLQGLKLTTVLINTIPGVPLFYTGEEVANDRPLDLFEKVEVDWTRPREIGELARSLFQLRREHHALVDGDMVTLSSGVDDTLYAFVRNSSDDKVLVVLNFSAEPRTGRIALPAEMLFGDREQVRFQPLFGSEEILATRDKPMEITLAGHGYSVLIARPK
jgi:glycosidase